MQLKLIRVNYKSNLFVIGKKAFWKNLFSNKVILDDYFFVDFVWNAQHGYVEQIYLNSPNVIKAESTIEIQKENILWQNTPNNDLAIMYYNMLANISKQQEL